MATASERRAAAAAPAASPRWLSSAAFTRRLVKFSFSAIDRSAQPVASSRFTPLAAHHAAAWLHGCQKKRPSPRSCSRRLSTTTALVSTAMVNGTASFSQRSVATTVLSDGSSKV